MATTGGHELQIEGLCKRYGETVALQDMTFTVQPGELFGFVGSNGAGKTITMRIALGVLSADSGTSTSAVSRSTWPCGDGSVTCLRHVGSIPR